MGRIRAGVVIVEDNKIALIRRERANRVYFVFPGGGVEQGETIEQGAIREAFEELGVHIKLIDLIEKVTFGESEQYFYRADIVGGEFGSGEGPEYSYSPESERGSYIPVWIELSRLPYLDIRPKEIVTKLLK